MSLRLAARATLPALFGFLLTLNLLRGGGLESFVAMIAAFVTQGGLLVGEFAALAGVRTLSYSRRLRAGVLMAVPLLAVGFVALIVYLYLGLGAEGASLTWVV